MTLHYTTYSLNMLFLNDSKHGVSDSVGFVTMHASRSAVQMALHYSLHCSGPEATPSEFTRDDDG
jgi:hypothetical protein